MVHSEFAVVIHPVAAIVWLWCCSCELSPILDSLVLSVPSQAIYQWICQHHIIHRECFMTLIISVLNTNSSCFRKLNCCF